MMEVGLEYPLMTFPAGLLGAGFKDFLCSPLRGYLRDVGDYTTQIYGDCTL